MARIGFIGVGMLGHGMAANLGAAGHDLTVIAHRNRARVEDLVAKGAAEAPDPATLSADSEIIFLCLSDSDAVESVIGGLKAQLQSGQTIVDATTANPVSTKRLHGDLRRIGVTLVDAPVTGGPPQAEAGTLTTLVGAEEDVFRRVEPLLAAYCETILHVGGPGAGHTAKLMNNFVTQGTATLLALSYGLAREAGIDWSKLHAAMCGGAARSGTLQKMVEPALEGDYRGQSFSLANSWKDVRYFAALAESMGRRTPLVDGVEDALRRANACGFGDRFVSELLSPEVEAALKAQAPSD